MLTRSQQQQLHASVLELQYHITKVLSLLDAAGILPAAATPCAEGSEDDPLTPASDFRSDSGTPDERSAELTPPPPRKTPKGHRA